MKEADLPGGPETSEIGLCVGSSMEEMKESQLLLEMFSLKQSKGKKSSGFSPRTSLQSSLSAFHWPNLPRSRKQESLEEVFLYNTERSRGRVVMDLRANRGMLGTLK